MVSVSIQYAGREIVLPVAFAASLLLDTLWISVCVTMFGKVAREAVFRKGGTISQGAMVAVVSLVGASHCELMSACIHGNGRVDLLMRGE